MKVISTLGARTTRQILAANRRMTITGKGTVVMPLLARAKKKVAAGLGSGALKSDAAQTSLCADLSLIALIGVALNALLGWWWADPLAAIAMTPIIVKEGLEGLS